jgi:hypothetical protein
MQSDSDRDPGMDLNRERTNKKRFAYS